MLKGKVYKKITALVLVVFFAASSFTQPSATANQRFVAESEAVKEDNLQKESADYKVLKGDSEGNASVQESVYSGGSDQKSKEEKNNSHNGDIKDNINLNNEPGSGNAALKGGQVQSVEQSELKMNRFIIKYKSEKGRNDVSSLLNDKIHKVKKVKNKNNKILDVITTKEAMSSQDLKVELRNKKLDESIEYIQPDYELAVASNDTYYSSQWGISDTSQSDAVLQPEESDSAVEASGSTSPEQQVYRRDANVVPSWERSQGQGAVIAVLDTGIDITHEDLAENMWTNPSEIPANGIDDDGNGYIDDVKGWNFCDDSNEIHWQDMAENELHGTHIAGIIAAVKDNSKGIAGVAPKAGIMPLKVFNNGRAYTGDIIEAISYAEMMGIKIVNCSWGTSSYNPALKEAMEQSNMLFVAAAGNSGTNNDIQPVYPAAFGLGNVISVASIREDGNLSGFSNYGEASVDIAAPGENIMSTMPGNTYASTSGTSMAAAFVSGEAALIVSKLGDLGAVNIKERIVNYSDRLSSLIGKVYRGNKLNCSSILNGESSDKIIDVPISEQQPESQPRWEDTGAYSLYTGSGYGYSITITSVYRYEKAISITFSYPYSSGCYAQGLADGQLYDRPYYNNLYHSGLIPNTSHTYYFRVVDPYYGAGGWQPSAGLVVTTLSETPKNVRATPSVSSMTVSWDAVAGATGYDVEADGVVNYNITTTSYLHSGLSAGTQHTYRVRSKSGSNLSDWSSLITSTTNLVFIPSPSNVQTSPTETSITVVWDPVASVTGYEVEVDGVLVGNGMNTSYTHSGLTPNTPHTYRVRASNYYNRSVGEWSSLLTRYTLVNKSANVYAASAETAITVAWDAVEGATGYDIEVDGIVGDNGTSTTYVHSALTANTQHTYRVRAKNSNSTGNWSTMLTKYTLVALPGNISIARTETSIKITWSAVTGAAGYDIEVDGAILDNGTGTSYTHSGLTANTRHTYRVRAKNSNSTGNWSALVAKYTLISVPGNIRATVNENSITILWNTVAGASAYYIEVDGVSINNGTSTTYVHQGLTPNTQHTYRVRAKNSNSTGNWSSILTKYTLVGTPVNIAAASTETSITVTWDQAIGAAGYDIEVDGVIKDNGTSTSYTHTGLTLYNQHTYRVRAKCSNSVGNWSAQLVASTQSKKSCVVDCLDGKQFNLITSAQDVQTFGQRKFTITYNSSELEVVDLYAETNEIELTAESVNVLGYLNIVSFAPGNIVFTVNDTIPAGFLWSGVINTIKFKSLKASGQSTIAYTVQ